MKTRQRLCAPACFLPGLVVIAVSGWLSGCGDTARSPGGATSGSDAGGAGGSGSSGSPALGAGAGQVAGSGGTPVGAAGSGGMAGAPMLPDDSCALAADQAPSLGALQPLYVAADAKNPPIVTKLADGTILTRGAGRVRNRQEKDQTFNTYGPMYFEDRSFGFMVEDFTPTGEQRIRVTYLPITMPDDGNLTTNWRAWKTPGDNGTFLINATMTNVATTPLPPTGPVAQAQQYDTTAAPTGRSMAMGESLEFEFGLFIEPTALKTPGSRTSYHADTFRYVMGVGGLTPNNTDTPDSPGPVPEARLGGDTTLTWLFEDKNMYFSQMALNIQQENAQSFLEGRRLFQTDFATGEHGEATNPAFLAHSGQAGPVMVSTACWSCHINNGPGAPPTPTTAEASRYATRLAPQLVGLGLLEAVDEQTILALADRLDCDQNGISGRPSYVMDPATGTQRLGRFGWKADVASLTQQVAVNLSLAMGVGTSLLPDGGKAEIEDPELAQLVTYTSLLGVPPQRDHAHPQTVRGREVFQEIGCADCHVPQLITGANHPFAELRQQTIQPFTDLLLHDMGPGLADASGVAAGEQPSSPPSASEWRTPPLWGLGLRVLVNNHLALLHDGRAANIVEAIQLHGGEGAAASLAYMALLPGDRDALAAFLMSL